MAITYLVIKKESGRLLHQHVDRFTIGEGDWLIMAVSKRVIKSGTTWKDLSLVGQNKCTAEHRIVGSLNLVQFPQLAFSSSLTPEGREVRYKHITKSMTEKKPCTNELFLGDQGSPRAVPGFQSILIHRTHGHFRNTEIGRLQYLFV